MKVSDLLSIFLFGGPTKLIVMADGYGELWSGRLCDFFGANPAIDWECDDERMLVREFLVDRADIDEYEINTLTVYVDGSGLVPTDDGPEEDLFEPKERKPEA